MATSTIALTKDFRLNSDAIRITRNANNTTSYTFDCPRQSTGSYSYFLLMGGTSSERQFLFHGFVHVDREVVLTPIINNGSQALTATYSGTTMTITAPNTLYGGLRLIWLS